jgi:hypothetical protein
MKRKDFKKSAYGSYLKTIKMEIENNYHASY